MKDDTFDVNTMFDEIKEVNEEKVNGRLRVSEQPAADMDFAKACKRFVAAHRTFEHWDSHPDKYADKKIRLEWWHALERLSNAERKVWHMFVGESPTLVDNMQYAQFRELLLAGRPTKANA
jgi:hypothetical protein